MLLAPGTFHVSGTLKITASGVVLRGSGSGQKAGPVTEVEVTGTPTAQQDFLSIQGTGSWETTGGAARITDAYAPSGATSFTVNDASGLAVGDAVAVERPVTQAWVHFMGMDTLVRDGGAADLAGGRQRLAGASAPSRQSRATWSRSSARSPTRTTRST